MNQLNEKGLITGLEQNTPLMNVDSFIPKAVPSTQNAKARRKGWPVGYSSVHIASAEGTLSEKTHQYMSECYSHQNGGW